MWSRYSVQCNGCVLIKCKLRLLTFLLFFAVSGLLPFYQCFFSSLLLLVAVSEFLLSFCEPFWCYLVCKQLHCHHHSHTSDGEMPAASSGVISHHFAPVASRSSHSSQSNSGIYGYVYRDPVLSIPQRSLESPRACEVLLDLDRSKPRDPRAPEAQRGLDLMSRSYHSHYHSAYLYRPDVSPSEAEKSSDVSRRTGTASYGNMPDVLAAQVSFVTVVRWVLW